MGKIISAEKLAALRAGWQRAGKRVVLAAGAFELLHPGHVRLLEQARELGDVLLVAIEDDATIRAALATSSRSTPKRPVNPQAERAEILAALAAVDFVIMLHGNSAGEWAKSFGPEVYVQGGTGAANKRETGRMVRIPLEPGYSTASLIERIQQLPQ